MKRPPTELRKHDEIVLYIVTHKISRFCFYFVLLWLYQRIHTIYLPEFPRVVTFQDRTLQWRHNGRDSVSNHQPHDCLLNRLFRRRSKKTSKFRVTGICARNSPGTGEFPAQMASNAENVSIWWRHHERDPAWYEKNTKPQRNTTKHAPCAYFLGCNVYQSGETHHVIQPHTWCGVF